MNTRTLYFAIAGFLMGTMIVFVNHDPGAAHIVFWLIQISGQLLEIKDRLGG